MSSGTIFAFDFGIKRIGVAVAELALGTARPLTVITTNDNRARFAAIAALIDEWKPVRLIVGEPQHADGRDHAVAQLARRFAHRLDGRFGIPVELIDETLSSHAAGERLHERGTRGKPFKASLDAEAACVILETWIAHTQQKTSTDP